VRSQRKTEGTKFSDPGATGITEKFDLCVLCDLYVENLGALRSIRPYGKIDPGL
jgi:hypothetical protein